MRNKRITLLDVFYTLVGVLTLAFLGCRQHVNLETDQGKDNLGVSQASLASIKGKLFRLAALDQAETDYVDLSPYKDLLIALLQPSERTKIEQARSPHCCELLFERTDSSLVRVNVVWLGAKSKLIYATQDPYCYTRTGPYFPIAGEKWKDESNLLCYFIQCLSQKDFAQARDWEKQLRRSVGIEKGD